MSVDDYHEPPEPPDPPPAQSDWFIKRTSIGKIRRIKTSLVDALRHLGFEVNITLRTRNHIKVQLKNFELAEDSISDALSICEKEVGDQDFEKKD